MLRELNRENALLCLLFLTGNLMDEVRIGGCLGHRDYESVKIVGAAKKTVSRDATKSGLLADQGTS